MLINVDKCYFKISEKNNVHKLKVKNVKSTSYPPEKIKYNPLKYKKLGSVEETYNHIHTAYDKY